MITKDMNIKTTLWILIIDAVWYTQMNIHWTVWIVTTQNPIDWKVQKYIWHSSAEDEKISAIEIAEYWAKFYD